MPTDSRILYQLRQNIGTGVQFQPFTAPEMHEEFKIGDRVVPRPKTITQNWYSKDYKLIVQDISRGRTRETHHLLYLKILVSSPYQEDYTVRLPAEDFEPFKESNAG